MMIHVHIEHESCFVPLLQFKIHIMMSQKNSKKFILNFFCFLILLVSASTLQGQSSVTPKYTIREDADGDGVKNRKDQCAETPRGVAVDAKGCPLDTDKDGVVDYLDKCPDVPGSKTMNGCQDKDNDGVADNEDLCPDVPGLARFKGCPDSDGDGIEDSKDKCPNIKGLDFFHGCPDTDGDGVEDSKDKCPDTQKGIKVDENGCGLDSDKDGVIDSEDKCPDTKPGVKVDEKGCASDNDADGVIDSEDKCPNTKPGIKVDEKGCPADSDGDGIIDSEDKCPTVKGDGNNNGCPEVKKDVAKRLQFAARGINFETGNATLKPSSYPMLDEVVAILNEYVDYDLKMGGHTDNVGNDASNLTLSQSRVDAVKSYLISKGVSDSRIVATGYGETMPIGDNATAKGKEQNRRVELQLVLRNQ
jgi:outer membrane protein OmpA-like peptidoglycan-associated protein